MKKFLSSLLLALTVLITASPAFADEPTNTCPNGQILRQYESAVGTVVQNGTPTPDAPIEPVFYTQGDMVLRKIDDTYYDSYDATTGKITRRVGMKVLDGTEHWTVGSFNAYPVPYITISDVFSNMANIGSPYNKNLPLILSHFIRVTCNSNDSTWDNNVQGAVAAGGPYFAVRWGNNDSIAVDDLKEFLASQYSAGTPMTVYYPLATPVEETPASTTYCADPIKIATTAYNDAQFAPVEAALETAVTTIKDVVANTIVQADAIQNLQDTKQTMPDASGTNGTCPRFRQCLLIETDDGTPQWFQIADPYRDLITPMAQNKTQTNIGTVSNYASARGFAANGKNDPKSQYYNGDVTLRQATDNTTSVSVRQFSDTNLSGGQYKNLSNREWAVTWDGDEMTGNSGDFLPGIVYGESKCTSVGGTKNYVYDYPTLLSSLTNEQQADWATEWTASTASNYAHCWCKMTAVGLDGAITPVGSAAPWVFYYTYASAGICAQYCANNCADGIRGYSAFRSSVLGWAVQ